METFAYLCHIASHAEANGCTESVFADPARALQNEPPRRLGLRFSSLQLRLLPAALLLTLLSTVGPALALKKGDSGPEVRTLQTSLKQRGFFTGQVDGKYGAQTEQAVRRFQTASGLKSDGVVGRATLTALQSPAQGGPSLTPSEQSDRNQVLRRGATGTAVTDLQNRLRQLGFYTGPVNGQYGPLTEAAVRRMQRSLNLKPDGIYGPKTALALQSVRPANQSSTPGGVNGTVTSTAKPEPPTTATNNKPSALRRGNQGSQVSVLQERLKTAGVYQGGITGVYDDLTEAAVKQFQANSNLPVDGVAGTKTQQALALLASNSTAQPKSLGATSTTSAPAALEPNPSPETPLEANLPQATSTTAEQPSESQPTAGTKTLTVLELQKRLKEQGFNPGPLDGKMGPKTTDAIRAAERYYGVSADKVKQGQFEP